MTTRAELLRYAIQREPDGRWLIVNAKDAQFAWTGSFWVDRDCTSRVLRFESAREAEAYADETFR